MIQAWDFVPGSNFVMKMDRASKSCNQTIAVLSPAFLESGFTAAEWAVAFARDPTGEKGLVVPVRVRECDPEGLLGQIVYVDLIGLGKRFSGQYYVTKVDHTIGGSGYQTQFEVEKLKDGGNS